KNVLRRSMADGLSVTFLGSAPDSEPFTVRQLWIRFDKSGRAVEIRCRYDDADGSSSRDWPSELLKLFQSQAGAPAQSTPPCLKALADLPAHKPLPVFLTWRDDASQLSYERDSGGVAVCLVDCPPNYEGGVPLPPLGYLPRGTEGCVLGSARDDLLKNWKIDKPVSAADGALVLRPAPSSPYDALLVWFKDGRAARIVARHRADGVKRTTPAEWA